MHMATSHVVSCAAVFGWSSRLGLAEASHSEPLVPRPAALPHAAVLGAAMAVLRYRCVCTADPPHVMMLSLSSHCCHIHTYPLHLCAVAGPVRVASAARTWVGHRHLII